MSQMEEIMKKRQKEAADAYESMWNGGKGSHHPDYDPEAVRCPLPFRSASGGVLVQAL
jgi:hypothetical protein